MSSSPRTAQLSAGIRRAITDRLQQVRRGMTAPGEEVIRADQGMRYARSIRSAMLTLATMAEIETAGLTA
jgi:hypothetical protein